MQSLRLAAVRLESASQGYAPLFGDRTVDANVLQQVIAFDLALSAKTDLLSSDADAILASMALRRTTSLLAATTSVGSIDTLLGEFRAPLTILASGAREAGQSLSSIYGRSEPGLTAAYRSRRRGCRFDRPDGLRRRSPTPVNSMDDMVLGYLLDAGADDGSSWHPIRVHRSCWPRNPKIERRRFRGIRADYSLSGAATLRDTEGRSKLGDTDSRYVVANCNHQNQRTRLFNSRRQKKRSPCRRPIEDDAITIYGKPG